MSSSKTVSSVLRDIKIAMRKAISIGAPAFNNGDAKKCADVYEEVIQKSLQSASTLPALHRTLMGIASERLESGRKERNDSKRAWTFRHILDDILDVDLLDIDDGDADDGGDYIAQNLISVFSKLGLTSSAVGSRRDGSTVETKSGAGKEEGAAGPTFKTSQEALAHVKALFAKAIEGGAPAYNKGDIERCASLYDTAISDAAKISASFAAGGGGAGSDDPDKAAFEEHAGYLNRTLAHGRAAATANDRAWIYRHCLDAVRSASSARTCIPLQYVKTQLKAALDKGVPAYNRGDAAGCAAAYDQVLTVAVRELKPVERASAGYDAASAALAKAKTDKSNVDKAWTLRKAIDAINSLDENALAFPKSKSKNGNSAAAGTGTATGTGAAETDKPKTFDAIITVFTKAAAVSSSAKELEEVADLRATLQQFVNVELRQIGLAKLLADKSISSKLTSVAFPAVIHIFKASKAADLRRLCVAALQQVTQHNNILGWGSAPVNILDCDNITSSKLMELPTLPVALVDAITVFLNTQTNDVEGTISALDVLDEIVKSSSKAKQEVVATGANESKTKLLLTSCLKALAAEKNKESRLSQCIFSFLRNLLAGDGSPDSPAAQLKKWFISGTAILETLVPYLKVGDSDHSGAAALLWTLCENSEASVKEAVIAKEHGLLTILKTKFQHAMYRGCVVALSTGDDVATKALSDEGFSKSARDFLAKKENDKSANFIVANLSTKEPNSALPEGTIPYCITLLQLLMKAPNLAMQMPAPDQAESVTILEVLWSLSRLCLCESYLKKLLRKNLPKTLFELLENPGLRARERLCVFDILNAFSLDKDSHAFFNKPEVKRTLLSYRQNRETDAQIRHIIDGIIFEISQSSLQPSSSSSSGTSSHSAESGAKMVGETAPLEKAGKYDAMISYCWTTKPFVLKMRDQLEETFKLRLWIDDNDMSGDIVEEMARAVDSVHTVIAFIGLDYQNSTNCRREMKYAHKKRKIIIYVLCDPKQNSPDGWLLLIMEDAKYIDCRAIAAASAEASNDGSLAAKAAEIHREMTGLFHRSFSDISKVVGDTIGKPAAAKDASGLAVKPEKPSSTPSSAPSSPATATTALPASPASTALFAPFEALRDKKHADIAALLADLEFEEYTETFKNNKVNGNFLMRATEEDMRKFIPDDNHRISLQKNLEAKFGGK